MKQLRLAILLITSLIIGTNSHAQDKSNRGKEFWLSYGFDYSFFWETPVNFQELALYISTEQAATVTVSISNTGFTQTLSIPANTVDASILIPKSGPNDARVLTDGPSNKGIHIVSDVPVAVYAHVYSTQVSGATMLMPVETNGFVYHSVNYYQTTSQSSPPDWYSWFYAIASEDNTRLEITPSDTTKNGWLPGQTYVVNLNKGESYHVFGKAVFDGIAAHASKDMTGSKVVSIVGGDGNCHPFALFSGSGGIRLCRGDGGEFVHQQVFPEQAWGTRYLTYHTINNINTDIVETNRNYYRVCVLDPLTVVKKNGVTMTGLINNFYYEYMDSTGGDYIEANKPILVSQYTPNKNQCWNFPVTTPSPPSYGDPEMFYLSPIEQGQKSVIFYTPRKSSIDYVYANIHFPTSGAASLRVDGNPLPATQIIAHPNLAGYSVAVARFIGPAAQHKITCDSTFTSTVYGLGNYESYGYNVGTLINNLNSYSTISNTLNTNNQTDTFTCPNTPVRLYVKLGFQANSIHWKLSQVPGMSPSTDSIILTPSLVRTEVINARTYYVYTLQQDFTFNAPGTYNIPVSFTATVIPNCNHTENANLRVVVKPGPKPDFSFVNLCLTDTVRFNGTTPAWDFPLTSYLWTFHDNATQNTVNGKKLYPGPGNYDVRYRVVASNGCVGDTLKTITLTNATAPALSISATGKPCVDSVFTFTSSIAPGALNPLSWYWDFGDGQTVTSNTQFTQTHAYTAAAAAIKVKLVVKLSQGCSPDTAYYNISVIYTNPVASFTITGDTLCEKKPLRFDSPLTGISTWSWNFGNGNGSQVPPFNYEYNTAGNYTPSLVVHDAQGCGSAAATQNVSIKAAPVVNAGPDQFISVGASAQLNATVTPVSIYNILWTPSIYLTGASTLSPVSTPPADNPVTYTITVTDQNSLCSASDQVVITAVSQIYIPTAFTPNRDGRNDMWTIPGLALYPEALVTVYNRWGEKVYESKDYYHNPWNGKYKGVLQPIGIYVYIIQLDNTKTKFLKGTFTLVL